MIVLDRVHKRYRGRGVSRTVLRDTSLVIPAGARVGLIGGPGSGRSTFIRLLAGIDQPSGGSIDRRCLVSWPISRVAGLNAHLSGRVNARFVCRLEGHADDAEARLRYIHEFSELGDWFDRPVAFYTSAMRSQLQFAMSLAFQFDIYLSDEVTAVGEGAFRAKTQRAFRQLAARSGLVLASDRERTLREFCDAGIWLHDGRAHWFDKLDDALRAHRENDSGKPKA